jgi:hypothetical protein
MHSARASAVLSVMACLLVVGVGASVAYVNEPKASPSVPIAGAGVAGRGWEGRARQDGRLIDRLERDAASPLSGVETVSTTAAAAAKAAFPVLVPADTKGRAATAVYVKGLSQSATVQGAKAIPTVYLVYGEDLVVAQYARPEVKSAREALFGVLNNPPTSEIAEETTVRGGLAVKWNKSARAATLESTPGANDGQYGYSTPFSEVIWWEKGVCRWVGSDVLTVDDLVDIANSMK